MSWNTQDIRHRAVETQKKANEKFSSPFTVGKTHLFRDNLKNLFTPCLPEKHKNN